MTIAIVESLPVVETVQTQRRMQILTAAETCFARSGFHGTSMHEICQEAGMSPGALYRYFRSKDEIIIAIAEEERAQNAIFFAIGGSEGSFHDRLVRMGVEFLTEMARPGKAALMTEILAESLRNSTIGAQFQVNECDCRTFFQHLVTHAVEIGEIEPPVDFDMALSCMMATGEGLVIRMAFDPTLTIERVEPMLRHVTEALFPPRRGTGSQDC